MILGLGARLILSRLRFGAIAHRLHLPHSHDHHRHDHHATSSTPWRTLFWLGLADGLTPSPSALVVLLAAVTLGRLELGIALIVAFSVGLALVLTGISVSLIGLRGLVSHVQSAGTRAGLYRPWMERAGPALPALAGAAVLVVGLVLTFEAITRNPAL
jgi:ABC-type nickel/cobalt efflux system permease component RcnA